MLLATCISLFNQNITMFKIKLACYCLVPTLFVYFSVGRTNWNIWLETYILSLKTSYKKNVFLYSKHLKFCSYFDHYCTVLLILWFLNFNISLKEFMSSFIKKIFNTQIPKKKFLCLLHKGIFRINFVFNFSLITFLNNFNLLCNFLHFFILNIKKNNAS